MRVSWTPLYPGLHQDSMTLVTSEWASLSFSLLSKPGTGGNGETVISLLLDFFALEIALGTRKCVYAVCVWGGGVYLLRTV